MIIHIVVRVVIWAHVCAHAWVHMFAKRDIERGYVRLDESVRSAIRCRNIRARCGCGPDNLGCLGGKLLVNLLKIDTVLGQGNIFPATSRIFQVVKTCVFIRLKGAVPSLADDQSGWTEAKVNTSI